MTALPFTSLGTILIVVFIFFLSTRVGRKRGVVLAPATTGDAEFEKAFRIHYNTIEQTVMFLPLLWLSTLYWGDMVSGGIIAVWLIGRIIYMNAYQKDPTTRTAGMIITLLALAAALVGSVIPLVQMIL
jgi:glutathione S-transferase